MLIHAILCLRLLIQKRHPLPRLHPIYKFTDLAKRESSEGVADYTPSFFSWPHTILWFQKELTMVDKTVTIDGETENFQGTW